MFIAPLFSITKTWKQPKFPSTDEQIKKMYIYIYTHNGIYIYIHIHTHWNIYIYTHWNIYIYTRAYNGIYIYRHIHTMEYYSAIKKTN